MDALKKAEQRAILPIENCYVFNDIYFGNAGLTSASASHVSAMANVMAQDIKERIKGLRLYKKFIRVIGEDEVCVEERNDTLSNIENDLDKISKANALIAWLREAIKEREKCIDQINNVTISDFCRMKGIELGQEPTCPKLPSVNFEDMHTILEAGLTVKEYNRFLELNSTLAVYGEIIHERGIITLQKKRLQEIAKNPVEVQAGGRDTIITRYEADSVESLDATYTALQAKYRKLQAEKNGLEAKWSDLAANYQLKLKREFDDKLAEYRKACDEYEVRRAEANSALTEWKKSECDEVSSLKIIIPNDLVEIYKELQEKYL